MKKIILTCFISLIVITNAYSASIIENDDFPNRPSLGLRSPDAYEGFLNLGLLELGKNTIQGSLNGSCNQSTLNGSLFLCNDDDRVIGGIEDSDNLDSFLVEIGENNKINNISVTLSNFTESDDGLNLVPGFGLYKLFKNPIYSHGLTKGDGVTNISVNYPQILGSGLTLLSISGETTTRSGSFALDWSIEVDIIETPIPTTVWLFISGFACLLGFRRYNFA